jgi:hypothetical protein
LSGHPAATNLRFQALDAFTRHTIHLRFSSTHGFISLRLESSPAPDRSSAAKLKKPFSLTKIFDLDFPRNQ